VGTLANLTVTNPITGSVTGSSGSTTGNAATATALQTARTINGVSFNGTADITVAAAAGTLTGTTLASNVVSSSLTSVGTLSTLTVNGTTNLASTSGNVGIGGSLGTTPTLNKAVYLQSNTNNDVIGYSLYVNDGVNNRRGSMFLDDAAGVWGWDTTASSGLPDYVWRSGAAERMRLSSSGVLLVNDTNARTGNRLLVNDVNGYLSYGAPSVGSGRMQYEGGPGNVFNIEVVNTTGAIAFRLEGGSGIVERARIDSAGNLGLGVTPSAWSSVYRAAQFGSGASISGRIDTVDWVEVMSNARRDGTGTWNYLATAASSRYLQTSGTHSWHIAPSGTAGNTISFTQAMTLDASGNLGVGTTSPGARLDVSGADGVRARVVATSSGTSGIILSSAGATAWTIKAGNGDSSLRFEQDGVNRWAFASGGNLIASADNTYDIGLSGANRPRNMYVAGTGNFGNSLRVIGEASVIGGGTADGIVISPRAAGTGTKLVSVNNNNTVYTPATLTGSIVVFETNGETERARIDTSGNVLIGMTATATSSAKTLHLGNATVPTANPTGGGVLYVEAGALKFRGSSGTITTIANA
jgi:hypothetical protein